MLGSSAMAPQNLGSWPNSFEISYVQTNHHVTSVGFNRVALSNEEWKTICNAIRIHNAEQTSIVRRLGLVECFGSGLDIELLNDILASNAEVISLHGNRLSSRDA